MIVLLSFINDWLQLSVQLHGSRYILYRHIKSRLVYNEPKCIKHVILQQNRCRVKMIVYAVGERSIP